MLGFVRIMSGVARMCNFHHLCFPMLRICQLRSAIVRRMRLVSSLSYVGSDGIAATRP